MTTDYAARLTSSMHAGLDLDAALADLRQAGASPIEAIKALHESQGLALPEAKQRLCANPAWADIAGASAILHEQLAASVVADQP